MTEPREPSRETLALLGKRIRPLILDLGKELQVSPNIVGICFKIEDYTQRIFFSECYPSISDLKAGPETRYTLPDSDPFVQVLEKSSEESSLPDLTKCDKDLVVRPLQIVFKDPEILERLEIYKLPVGRDDERSCIFYVIYDSESNCDMSKFKEQLRSLEPTKFLLSVFAVASDDLKEEAQRGTIKKLETEKNLLTQLMTQALKQPRQMMIGGDYFETHGDLQITNIEFIQAIEEIKKAVERVPKDSFKDKSKKKVLEHIDNLAKEATKVGAKAAGKKLFEFAKTELLPIIPNVLKMLSNFNLSS